MNHCRANSAKGSRANGSPTLGAYCTTTVTLNLSITESIRTYALVLDAHICRRPASASELFIVTPTNSDILFPAFSVGGCGAHETRCDTVLVDAFWVPSMRPRQLQVHEELDEHACGQMGPSEQAHTIS